MGLFSKNIVGLDIADHSIEVIELQKSFGTNRPKVVSRFRMSLAAGVVERGQVVLQKQLLTALDEAMAHAQPRPIEIRDVVFGIPERQVYTAVLHLKRERGQSIRELIESAAQETIPLEHDDLVTVYRTIATSDRTVEALMYGMSKEVLISWQEFFDGSSYVVRAYDHELLAVARGLFGRRMLAPICVVDVGAERTKVAIYSLHGLRYVNSLEVAGDVFTERIAKSLDIPLQEAEQQKREQGMVPVSFHALFKELLVPIVTEVQTACSLFEEREKTKITEIVLVGGSARLKGLPEYLQEQTGWACRRGSPFLALGEEGERQDSLHYIEAIGLALKGVDSGYWERHHPSFPPVPAVEE
ncbi:MAG: pilus assembly protein PilM [Patescibacteria group bacterium]